MPQYPFYHMIYLPAMENGGEAFLFYFSALPIFCRFFDKTQTKKRSKPQNPSETAVLNPKKSKSGVKTWKNNIPLYNIRKEKIFAKRTFFYRRRKRN